MDNDPVASILSMPSVVHDVDGERITVSVEARAELLRLAQAGDVYDCWKWGEPDIWAITLVSQSYNDDTVADWVRAFDANRNSVA